MPPVALREIEQTEGMSNSAVVQWPVAWLLAERKLET